MFGDLSGLFVWVFIWTGGLFIYLFIYYYYLVTFNGSFTLAFEQLCLLVWPGMRRERELTQ